MRAVCVVLVLLILGLQYKAWFSDSGHFALSSLRAEVAERRARADELERGNRLLEQEVLALKRGNAAIEARARQDLGMVREDEVFFLVPEPDR